MITIRDPDVQNFLQSLPDPLPHEEQDRLIDLYHEGDRKAGDRVIVTNIRLVAKIICDSFRWSDCEFSDLLQAGTEGLLEARERYDTSADCKFTSYASFWIRAKIFQESNRMTAPFRLDSGRAHRKALHAIPGAMRAIRREGKIPTTQEIADRIDGVSEDVIKEIANAKRSMSLDAERTTSGDSLHAFLFETTPDPSAAVDARRWISAFAEFGETIEKERERDIWYSRIFCLGGDTLVRLGDRWGVSRECIRQIEIGLKAAFVEWAEDRGFDVEGIPWST